MYKRTYSKYGNKKVEYDGYKFDSMKERSRYMELKIMQEHWKIRDMVVHPKPAMVLLDKFENRGTKYRAITYLPDFKYFDEELGVTVIEDVKGWDRKKNKHFTTADFDIKWKMVIHRYGGQYIFKII